MRRGISLQLALLAGLLAVCSIPAFLPGAGERTYLFDILFTLNMAILLASSWNILGGFAGQVSFGHAGFYGIGAYTLAIITLHLHWSPWLALPFSGAGAVLAALIVGSVSFRLRGPYFALATLALAEVAKLVAEGLRGLTQGTQGIVITQAPLWGCPPDGPFYFLLSLLLAGLGVGLSLLIRHSDLHYLLRAVGDNEDAAAAAGVNSWQAKMLALGASAFLAGLAGGLGALHTGFIDPESGFDMAKTVEPIFMTIVGGIGTVAGPLLGALLLVPVGELLRSQFATAHLLFYGIMLVIFARFMPKGLMGLFRKKP